MSMEQLAEMIRANVPFVVQLVLMGLGSLAVLGGVYVKMTPTEDDDKWWAALESKPIVGHLLKLLVHFSPVFRKEK